MSLNPHFAQLAARIFSRPLMAEPWAAACVLGVLAERLGIETVVAINPETGKPEEFQAGFLAGTAQDFIRESREYSVEGGVATIPVMGSLVSRSGRLQPRSGATGYSAIEAATAQAMADSDVRGVLFDVDSPGGEASGCLEAARYISKFRGQKPMWTIATPQAASAAYALASATDRIITSRGGDIGSIGVLGIHVNREKELAGKGMQVTIFQKGKKKALGHPFGPLDDEAKDSIDKGLSAKYDEFVGLVSENRRLSDKAVRDTEADTFDGDEAKRLGLVDAVMDPRDAKAEFASYVNGSPGSGARSVSRETGMNTQTHNARTVALAVPEHLGIPLQRLVEGLNVDTILSDSTRPLQDQRYATMTTFTQADLDKARADGLEAGRKEAKEADGIAYQRGVADGKQAVDLDVASAVQGAMSRVKDILGHAEAQHENRRQLAHALAFTSQMSVEAAVAALQAVPVVESAAPPAPAASAQEAPPAPELNHTSMMSQIPNPVVGPDGEGDDEELNAMLSNIRKIRGEK